MKILLIICLLSFWKVVMVEGIQCYDCKTISQEDCKNSKNLIEQECHEPLMTDKEKFGSKSACIKVVFKNGHIHRKCGENGKFGTCEKMDKEKLAVETCSTCTESLCNNSDILRTYWLLIAFNTIVLISKFFV